MFCKLKLFESVSLCINWGYKNVYFVVLLRGLNDISHAKMLHFGVAPVLSMTILRLEVEK